WHGDRDRPAAAAGPRRARAHGRVDAVPGGRGVPRVVRARRVRATRRVPAGRAVACRRGGWVCPRDARRQARRGSVAPGARAQARGPLGPAGRGGAAAVRGALRARVAGGRSVRADRPPAPPAVAPGALMLRSAALARSAPAPAPVALWRFGR